MRILKKATQIRKTMKGKMFLALVFGVLLCIPVVFNGTTEMHSVHASVTATAGHTPPIDENLIVNGSFALIRPRHSVPAIVERGETLSVIVESVDFTDIYLRIETAYERVVDEIYLEVEEHHKESDGIHVTARIPESTPEELYNLTVIVENGGYYAATEPRAVSVVDAITDTFTFAHITDFHIGDIRGFKENVRETIGWKAAKKCIEEINLLKPDFVVITGDLVFGQLYPFEYSVEYPKCYDILQLFQVPTYLIPGNHDGYIQSGQDGFLFWQQYFGPLTYSFDYGNSHFISVNSYDWPPMSRMGFSYLVFNWGGYVQPEQMNWIEQDLQESADAQLTFMMLHHNPLWETENDSLLHNGYEGRTELLTLIETYGVDAVLAGHVHWDNITVRNGVLYITTTTCASDHPDDAYWGYRLVGVDNGTIVSYNYREPHYSIPSYRLNVTFENEHRARIHNDLAMDVDAHVVFTLPAGDYTVVNGDVVMERTDGENMELYVVSHVDARTEKEVYVE